MQIQFLNHISAQKAYFQYKQAGYNPKEPYERGGMWILEYKIFKDLSLNCKKKNHGKVN